MANCKDLIRCHILWYLIQVYTVWLGLSVTMLRVKKVYDPLLFVRCFFQSKSIDIFLISPRKHMLWVLIRSASARHFKWVPTTYVFIEKQEKYLPDTHRPMSEPLKCSTRAEHLLRESIWWYWLEVLCQCTKNIWFYAEIIPELLNRSSA